MRQQDIPAHTQKMTGISFLDLPAEIRIMIYSYIIPHPKCFEIESNWFWSNKQNESSWSNFAALVSIRLSCSQINKEVLHQFFTMNAFAINVESWLNISITDGTCRIDRCDKRRIPILQYPSLRGFCMPELYVFTDSNVDDATRMDGIWRHWYILFKNVSRYDQEYHPIEFDEGYCDELEVEGRELLKTLVDEFAAETEGPYRGLEAKHLEQVIDSMNSLLERKVRAAYTKGTERQGRRRSTRIGSRPHQWYGHL